MHAEIISIGDELTSGQRLDTNSQWLATRLGEIGVTTVYHTTVADDLEANVRVFKSAIERADIVVATGGLGPTADDLTRDAIAAAADAPLHLDESALKYIESLFARRGQQCNPQPCGHGARDRLGGSAFGKNFGARLRATRRAGRDARDVGGDR